MNITELLAILLGVISLIGTLWKVFLTKAELDRAITRIDHRLDMLEQSVAHHDDKLELGINGTKELVGHLRVRTQAAEEKLSARLSDVEGFLTKTTDFTVRRH